jgi:hypothetical protein
MLGRKISQCRRTASIRTEDVVICSPLQATIPVTEVEAKKFMESPLSQPRNQ